MVRLRWSLIPFFAAGAAAQAQTDGNAVENADDAFGRRVGIESIGLYDEGQVRGFNLENAGNYRIEGNYFARAASPNYIIRQSTVTRIGVNALRYDFPAPSGVVEFQLKRAAPGAALSVESGYRASSGPFTDINASMGSSDGRLGIVGGTNIAPQQLYVNGAGGDYYSGGLVVRWAPAPTASLNAFASASDWVADPDTGVAPFGDTLPPRIKRGIFRAQKWAKFDQRQQAVGLFGNAALGSGWAVNGGLFHSAFQSDRTDFHLLELTDEDGTYRSSVFLAPRRSASAQSGSLLIERSWGSETLRHRAVATVRHRETVNRFTQSVPIDAGVGNLDGDYPRIREPSITFDKRPTVDDVKQTAVGVGYRLGIGGKLEIRADVQRTDYRKERADRDGLVTSGTSKPWLYSASAFYGVTDALTISGSYSRGLEESGTAPNSAVNRGEILPAVLATQRELGLRYSLTPSLSLIAGLFDTRKPTPGLRPDGRFALLGEVRHRGFEASLAGQLTPRLGIVAGLMVLDASLSGELVDAGLIGSKAVGRPSQLGLINLSYRVPGVEGLSLDGSINHEGSRYLNSGNRVKSDAVSTADIGLRYRFQAGKQPLTLRGRIVNVFNEFSWQPDVSGTLFPTVQRGYQLSLRADF